MFLLTPFVVLRVCARGKDRPFSWAGLARFQARPRHPGLASPHGRLPVTLEKWLACKCRFLRPSWDREMTKLASAIGRELPLWALGMKWKRISFKEATSGLLFSGSCFLEIPLKKTKSGIQLPLSNQQHGRRRNGPRNGST